MITVSSREFRANQKNYLDKVSHGLELLITRKNEAFKLTRVSEDDTLLSKEEFYAQLEAAIADAKAGRLYQMAQGETLDAFLDRMEIEGNV